MVTMATFYREWLQYQIVKDARAYIWHISLSHFYKIFCQNKTLYPKTYFSNVYFYPK